MRPPCKIRFVIAGLLLGTGCVAFAQSPDDSVYSLLQRLELRRLQIAFLERQLATETVPTRATKAAADLAALLIKEINEASPSDKIDLTALRLRELLQAHPEIRRPELQLAIWQSEFIRVEKLCHAAFDQSSEDIRSTAILKLNELMQSLQTAQREWEIEPNQSVGEGGTAKTPMEDTSTQGQRAREENLARVHFLTSWLQYYNGVLDHDPAEQLIAWRSANFGFRELLQIAPTQSIAEIDSERFVYTANSAPRIVLGLALTEQALGNTASAEVCFSFLASSDLRSRWNIWRLNSFVYPRQFGLTAQWLHSSRLASTNQRPSATDLAYVGERIARLSSLSSSRPAEQDLFLTEVLRHLLEMEEFDLVDRILNARDDLLPTITNQFHRYWLASRHAFQRGELSGRASDYAEAIAAATTALQNSAPQTPPKQLADLKLLLAWSLLRSGKHVVAAREFRQVAWIMRTLNPGESALAAWTGIQALVQSPAANKSPQQIFAAIDELVRMHPETTQAEQATLERLRLQAIWLNDARATEQLASIPPSDARFGEAQLALIVNQRERLLTANDDEATVAALLSSVSAVANRLAFERGSTDDRIFVKIQLLAADSALTAKPPNPEMAQQRIKVALDVVNRNRLRGPILSEIQALRFRRAQLAADNALANEMANWLAENAASVEMRLLGKIYQAEQYDRLLAENPNDSELLDQALQLYRRLSDQLGNSTAELKSSNNAFHSLTRLAELEMVKGQSALANEYFTKLLAAAPNDLATMQKTARCRIQQADYIGALELWRRVARGTSGEDWLEAKYHVILCLSHTSPGSVDEILDQTLALAKDMPMSWRVRFEKLRQGPETAQQP